MTEKAHLSKFEVPPSERLIVPLDVPDHDAAKRIVDELGDAVSFYKLGFELFLAGNHLEMAGWLRDRGKQLFVDLKLFDVPATVGAAVRQLRRFEARFATVHGNQSIIEAACKEKGATAILAVTVLTSLDQDDFADLGADVPVEKIVLSRARRVLGYGCDGVISSGVEARALREALGGGFLVVSPGIRPLEAPDDHKRTVTVEQAFRGGADYIVVGRPIRNAPSPKAKAMEIQEEIAAIFA
ncbi:MAG: orotidine-5'-phosphate decarboxylase [Myxococcota bacterium]